MIRYALKCDQDHSFDSWFASADAFDKVRKAGMVVCPVCGSTHVEKAMMAPRVSTSKTSRTLPAPLPPSPLPSAPVPAAPEAPNLSRPSTPLEAELSKLRAHVEKNSEYVGLSFAAEARKMHDGEIPHRAIYGEAKPQEAKQLLEDGVPVAPLPFMPQRKTN